jgi:hypothetical protein
VFHWDELFQEEVLKEESGHFQVIDGDLFGGDQIYNVLGPFDPPDKGV